MKIGPFSAEKQPFFLTWGHILCNTSAKNDQIPILWKGSEKAESSPNKRGGASIGDVLLIETLGYIDLK